MEDYCDNLKRQLYNHSLSVDDSFRKFANERGDDTAMEVSA